MNARARGTVPEYMRLPDNRKALDGLWELSIIVPIEAFFRHAMLRGSRSISDPSATLRVTVGWVGAPYRSTVQALRLHLGQGYAGTMLRGARPSASHRLAQRC